jgi:alpha-ketoglutarate-dependent 2,4-dichlorophenoxyacetate dioxygenase
MAIAVWPVTPGFAAEVGDVDLSRGLNVGDLSAIKQAFWDYSVLIFPEQELSEDQHLAFARYFGELEQVVFLKMNVKLRLRPELGGRFESEPAQ